MHIIFLFITIGLGWTILGLGFDVLCAIIGSIFNNYIVCGKNIKMLFFLYVAIGYLVMLNLKINTPMTKAGFKKISLTLFFKDIYYAIWWPYYLLNAKNYQNKDDNKNEN